MQDRDEEADSDREYDMSTRLDLRDYPGTVLVLMSLLGSSLAWLMYKKLGRKGSGSTAAPDGTTPGEAPAAAPPTTAERPPHSSSES